MFNVIIICHIQHTNTLFICIFIFIFCGYFYINAQICVHAAASELAVNFMHQKVFKSNVTGSFTYVTAFPKVAGSYVTAITN